MNDMVVEKFILNGMMEAVFNWQKWDGLIMTFDHGGIDLPFLIFTRPKENGEIEIVSCFYGEGAVKLYELITTGIVDEDDRFIQKDS